MAFYVTVRAVNRSFRFVPKRQIREAIEYCLAVTLEVYRNAGKLTLAEFMFMSNHYHLLGIDLEACLPDFVRDLNAMISRELNAIRGISGTNIEKGYNLVRIVGEVRLVEHAVYTLANPVRAHLVARSKHWKGVSSLKMQYGKPVNVKRPKHGLWSGKVAHADRAASKRSKRAAYAGRSKMPATAELVIDRPPVMMHLTDEELRAHILELLDQRELELINERKRRGFRVLGWDKVVAQHYLSIPNNTEELFTRTPSFSASNVWERIALAVKQSRFVQAYYAARDRYKKGEYDVAFPSGTWLMRKRFGVCCQPPAVT